MAIVPIGGGICAALPSLRIRGLVLYGISILASNVPARC